MPRLPVDSVQRLWDAAIAVSGDPSIGLRVGEQMHTGALGSFEYLLRHSGSVRRVQVGVPLVQEQYRRGGALQEFAQLGQDSFPGGPPVAVLPE